MSSRQTVQPAGGHINKLRKEILLKKNSIIRRVNTL
jgi:hypothetical protein